MSESPFKRLIKNKNDIILMPKSGKYDYVYIFMHGLFTSSSKYVDFFDNGKSPIPSNFKVIMLILTRENLQPLGLIFH